MGKAGGFDGTKDPGPDVCLFATVSDEPLDLTEGLFGANSSFMRSVGAFVPGKGGKGGAVMTVAERMEQLRKTTATPVESMDGFGVDVADTETTELRCVGYNGTKRNNKFYRYVRQGSAVDTSYGAIDGSKEQHGSSRYFGPGNAGVAEAWVKKMAAKRAREYDSAPDAKLGPPPADFLKRKADDQIARESKRQAKATLLVEALPAVTTAVWEVRHTTENDAIVKENRELLGRAYYFNLSTEKAQWECPEGFTPVEDEPPATTATPMESSS